MQEAPSAGAYAWGGECWVVGAKSDLPPVVVQEMRELEIYELFARHEQAARATPHHPHNNNDRKAAP